jgi:hypothetical protein
LLDAAQKKHRRLSAIELLKLLREREPFDFNGVITRDDSWSQYHYTPQEMFAASREQAAPYVRTQLGFKKL